MAVKSTVGTPRRTQAQRSAEMRQRLLDATVACLIDYGYAATTTARVVEKAGVTKGAQLHHFPSKESMVIAAIDYLARQRAQAAIGKIGRVEDSDDPASAVLEFLWESHQGPMFVATVELWVAARTNPALVHEVKRVEPLVADTLTAAVGQLLPGHAQQKALRNALFTAMEALQGIMLLGMIDQDPTSSRRRWDRACIDLHTIMAAALSEPAPL
ncbi:TetR/AcrR family transcriptional regulator [Mycolicibacterium sp. Dal123E01]|uniref:TetR/AcrR family transcriptional regulator n=1 Tax=Mycolicibacterium sp. Dal123E01 TaxID=3457578 RepID=UPI00403EDFB8